MNKIGLALSIMCKAFENKLDKGGHPYAAHCIRVWQGVLNLNEDAQCAAILHDLIEDTKWTYEMLIEKGFSYETIKLLGFLTHESDDSYEKYIATISLNKDAAEIKKSDLRDNMDPTRLKGVTKKDLDRIAKYVQSYNYLSKI